MRKSLAVEKLPTEAAFDLITHGKVLLLQKHPFYASLLLNMKFQPCFDIPTADIDGKTIRYNPNFILELNVHQVAGLLAHEVMHVAMLHHTRRRNRQPGRWNYACDYAINPILVKAGMILPDGALLERKFKNRSAETIYGLLPPPDEDEQLSFGEVRDPDGVEGKRNSAEIMAKRMVSQALLNAQLRGSVSEDLKRLIKKILEPAVNWKDAIAQFLTDVCKHEYNWSKPSPRFIYQSIYLPKFESIGSGVVVVVVDTSGSISDNLIDQFSSEISAVAGIFKIGILVIYVDSEIKCIQEFEPGEDIDLTPKGGGGTDFRPAFVYLNEQGIRPSAVIYLTDGECDDFPEEPDFPCLWAQFGRCSFEPPFGEVIQLSDN